MYNNENLVANRKLFKQNSNKVILSSQYCNMPNSKKSWNINKIRNCFVYTTTKKQFPLTTKNIGKSQISNFNKIEESLLGESEFIPFEIWNEQSNNEQKNINKKTDSRNLINCKSISLSEKTIKLFPFSKKTSKIREKTTKKKYLLKVGTVKNIIPLRRKIVLRIIARRPHILKDCNDNEVSFGAKT